MTRNILTLALTVLGIFIKIEPGVSFSVDRVSNRPNAFSSISHRPWKCQPRCYFGSGLAQFEAPYSLSMSQTDQNDSSPCRDNGTILPNNSRKSDLHVKRRSFICKNPLFLSFATAIAWDRINTNKEAKAAPPINVIAEELGYFPVTNSAGETMYISARVKRHSTEQAIGFAEYLRSSGAVMYGAFWCPHCQRQKEMFGREAWNLINYVECDGKGAGSNPRKCTKEGVQGFPTWKFKGGKEASGEMPLAQLAQVSGFRGSFDADLEPELPASSGSCK